MRSIIDAGTARTVDMRSTGLVNRIGKISPERHSSSHHSAARWSIWLTAPELGDELLQRRVVGAQADAVAHDVGGDHPHQPS